MTRQNESGRTMLEMLGVLGIMGIIMYGAVSGINYGMGTYKINQIYNDVQEQIQAVSDLYSWSRDYPNGETMTKTACDNDVFSRGCATSDQGLVGLHPYGAGIKINKPESGSFSIQYSGIPQDACRRLLEMEWGMIDVSSGTPPCESEDNNIITWTPKIG